MLRVRWAALFVVIVSAMLAAIRWSPNYLVITFCVLMFLLLDFLRESKP